MATGKAMRIPMYSVNAFSELRQGRALELANWQAIPSSAPTPYLNGSLNASHDYPGASFAFPSASRSIYRLMNQKHIIEQLRLPSLPTESDLGKIASTGSREECSVSPRGDSLTSRTCLLKAMKLFCS